jgi:hypothetical protein
VEAKMDLKIVNKNIAYPVWHVLKNIVFILDRENGVSSSFNNRTMEKMRYFYLHL